MLLTVRSEGLRAYIQVLNLLSEGERIDASAIVLEEDKHYYRLEEDPGLEQLVSARLLAAMRRKNLVREWRFWEITDKGRSFLRQRFRPTDWVN